MARYRTKDPVDLAWNKMRRHATMEIDMVFRDKREEVLNVVLGNMFEKFSSSLQKGVVLELEPGTEKFISEVINKALDGALAGVLDEPA